MSTLKMANSSLFSRIREGSLTTQQQYMIPNRADSVGILVESVKEHLEHLLNTRSGASQSCIDYGLTDLNDAAVGSKDQARSISRDIKRCIKHYETRLSDIEVSFNGYKNDDPTVLQFWIKCSFELDKINDRITLELYLDKDRQFKLL